DYPHLSDERLFACIPAPDFPTGGEVVDPQAVVSVYRTGKGSIPLRGTWHVETQGKGKRAKELIVITELPYGVVKADWLNRTAELLHQERLDGISDLRDESDRDGVRIVLAVKPGYNPQDIIQQLYEQTPLQTQFHASFLAIVDGRPQQCSLRRLLQHFLQFREQTLQRLYAHQYREVTQEIARVSALQQAISHLDVVFQILRQADDLDQARQALMHQLALTANQAETVLSTPLKRLTRLEADALAAQLQQLQQQQQRLAHLQQDRNERLRELKKQLRQLQKQFGSQPRRTRIAPRPSSPQQPLTVQLSASGFWRRVSVAGSRQLSLQLAALPEDPLIWQGILQPEQRLLMFGRRGGVQVLTHQDFASADPGRDWLTDGLDWDAGLLPVLISPEAEALWFISQGGCSTVMTTRDVWQGEWGFPADDAVLAVGIWQPEQTVWLLSNRGRVWQCTIPQRSYSKSLVKLAETEVLVGAVPVCESTSVQAITATGKIQSLSSTMALSDAETWVGLVNGAGPIYGYTNRQRWVQVGDVLETGEMLVQVVPCITSCIC
ncbi:MAG: hypothetical protein NZ482_08820, partial [Gloeomargarita sp. SKYG98]|nr:hypothetical protein [Gloeomargarita sp. SKYG98]